METVGNAVAAVIKDFQLNAGIGQIQLIQKRPEIQREVGAADGDAELMARMRRIGVPSYLSGYSLARPEVSVTLTECHGTDAFGYAYFTGCDHKGRGKRSDCGPEI